MQRSVGLVLSAIVLGLSALCLLLSAAFMVIAGIFLKAHPPTPAPPAFMVYAFYGLALMFAVLTAWAVVTVVGLIFLRIWARSSILVIGGMMAAMGGLLLLGILVALLSGQFNAPGAHPGATNQQMQIVFGFVALFYGVIAAVGVWWLVYFNLRSTKDAFLRRDTYDPATGLLMPPPPPSRRPTAITLLGCLCLLGTPMCAVLIFLPFPAFVFGFILSGVAGHALYFGIGLISAMIGIGLLRLHPAARIGAIGFLLIGCVNTFLSLLPWYQSQLRAYMEQFRSMFPMLANTPQPAYQYTFAQIALYGVFGLALNVFFIWLLHRHRAAFRAPQPVPSDGLSI